MRRMQIKNNNRVYRNDLLLNKSMLPLRVYKNYVGGNFKTPRELQTRQTWRRVNIIQKSETLEASRAFHFKYERLETTSNFIWRDAAASAAVGGCLRIHKTLAVYLHVKLTSKYGQVSRPLLKVLCLRNT